MSSSAAAQSEAKRPGDVSPVVFIVDDDISVRESLASLIGFAGWRTEAFESAREFLARPQEFAASCLVLDVHLPELSGMDLQQRIKDASDVAMIYWLGHETVTLEGSYLLTSENVNPEDDIRHLAVVPALAAIGRL